MGGRLPRILLGLMKYSVFSSSSSLRQDAFDPAFCSSRDRFMAYVLRMLGGNDHAFNMGRCLPLAISHGHLGLCSPDAASPWPRLRRLASSISLWANTTGPEEVPSFVREAKHDALVPRALFRMALCPPPRGRPRPCNVRGLFRKKVREKTVSAWNTSSSCPLQ